MQTWAVYPALGQEAPPLLQLLHATTNSGKQTGARIFPIVNTVRNLWIQEMSN